MNYGEKIATLRKEHGMTQAELGEQLYVTYQAVSKWERGESLPSFETMSRMAKLFGVPLEYFGEGQKEATHTAIGAGPDSSSVGGTEAPPGNEEANTERQGEPAAPLMIGVCTSCGSLLYEGEVNPSETSLICKACSAKKQHEELEKLAREKREREKKEQAQKAEVRKWRNCGLGVGIAVGGVFLIVFAVCSIVFRKWQLGVVGVCGGWMLFTVLSQLIWQLNVEDVGEAVMTMMGGVKRIGTPGLIFTFDLDGFIWLIGMKILFAVLRFIVFLVTLVFCFLMAVIVSLFTFFPCLHKIQALCAGYRPGVKQESKLYF